MSRVLLLERDHRPALSGDPTTCRVLDLDGRHPVLVGDPAMRSSSTSTAVAA